MGKRGDKGKKRDKRNKGKKRDLFKKILVVMIIGGMVLSSLATAIIYAYADEGDSSEPSISGESAIVYCENTGEIIYSKNENARMKPYSITKLLTALLAVRNLPMDQMVTVSAEAAAQGGSTIYLQEGEEISVEDLLYGALIASGNDAAYALAEAVSGTVADFVELMNTTAKNIGCTDTHFDNPSGLSNDIDSHYTTALDFLSIAKLAFSDETVTEIAGTEEYTIEATNVSEERELEEHTELLEDSSNGVIAAKTGYWDDGNCTIAAAYEKDGLRLIIIVLGDNIDDRAEDVLTLIEYAEENIQGVTVIEEGDSAGNVRVRHGAVTRVEAFAAEDGIAYLPVGGSESLINGEAVFDDDLTAPVKEGDVVGTYRIFVAGELVNEVELIAGEDIEEGWVLSYFGISNRATIIGGIVAGILFLGFMIIEILRFRARRRRRKLHRARVRAMAMEELRREQEERERGWRL